MPRSKLFGASELSRGLGDILRAMQDRVAPDVEAEQVAYLKDRLVENAPYDPAGGDPHLRDEIDVIKVVPQPPGRTEYRITFGDAYWWRFLEFGTSRQAATPFAQPTIDAAMPRLHAIQIRGLNDGIADAARQQRRTYRNAGGR